MTISTTYTCEICHTINSAMKLHCSVCGTIPARYSHTGKPIKQQDCFDDDIVCDTLSNSIPVVVAYGAQRLDHIRQTRHRLATVRHDYYADALEDSRGENGKKGLDKRPKL